MARKFKSGDRVKWMQKNQMVDHPEGRSHPVYGMLKVMRTIELYGAIQHTNSVGYDVLVDNRGYTMSVKEENLKMENK